MSGEIPKELGNLIDLIALLLHDNRLSGEIPKELNNLTKGLNNLTVLSKWRLAGNNFSGCVPYDFAQVSNTDLAILGLPTCDED